MNTLYYIFYFDEGTFLIFFSWLSRSEEQKTAPRKPAPTNNGDPGGNKISWLPHSTYLYLDFHLCSMTTLKEHSREICYKKIAFALKSNSHWWFMRQNITMVNTDEVVSKTISQEQRGLETGCRRAPRRFFSLQIVWQILFLKKYKL